MRDVVIGTIIALTGAVAAVFLILIAINIALFFKLRSIIPPSPRARPQDTAATKSDHADAESCRITATGSSLLYTSPRVPLCKRAR
jgi:hypothetical protein